MGIYIYMRVEMGIYIYICAEMGIYIKCIYIFSYETIDRTWAWPRLEKLQRSDLHRRHHGGPQLGTLWNPSNVTAALGYWGVWGVAINWAPLSCRETAVPDDDRDVVFPFWGKALIRLLCEDTRSRRQDSDSCLFFIFYLTLNSKTIM